jgi:hypothetical protein
MGTGRAKTGGRKRGTSNKRTLDVIERLEALGVDPIEGMSRLAMDPSNPPELRGRMYAELAQYLYPKRKAVEMTDSSKEPVIFQLGIASTPVPTAIESGPK